MSSKVQIGLTSSVIGLLIFGIIVGGYLIFETKNQSSKNEKTIVTLDSKLTNRVDDLNKRVNDFISKWENRINITNRVNNGTQLKLLGLQENASKIFDQQLINEQHILGNLTDHRHVANTTRDATFQILNQSLEQERQLLDLQNKTDTLTGSEYAKLADMRVKNIIGNISAEHEQIEQQHKEIINLLNLNSTNSTNGQTQIQK